MLLYLTSISQSLAGIVNFRQFYLKSTTLFVWHETKYSVPEVIMQISFMQSNTVLCIIFFQTLNCTDELVAFYKKNTKNSVVLRLMV